MNLRLFIAFEVEEQICNELRKQQDWLKPRHERVNWVRDDHFHLTLKFIPEVESSLISSIDRELDKLCYLKRAFEMQLAEPGFFGKADSPRILWTGIKGETVELAAFAGKIEKAMQAIGIEKELRRFKAHLTIGRVSACRSDLAASHMSAIPLQLDFKLKKLLLMQSTLKENGPEYNVLSQYILEEYKI
jgi:RNA 2',3'-cyclic 3'-phosphodiesterase